MTTDDSAASIPYEGTDCTPEEAVEAVKAVRGSAAWMRRFRLSYDVFTDDGLVGCECGWTWEQTGDTTLADAVKAAREHAQKAHSDLSQEIEHDATCRHD